VVKNKNRKNAQVPNLCYDTYLQKFDNGRKKRKKEKYKEEYKKEYKWGGGAYSAIGALTMVTKSGEKEKMYSGEMI